MKKLWSLVLAVLLFAAVSPAVRAAAEDGVYLAPTNTYYLNPDTGVTEDGGSGNAALGEGMCRSVVYEKALVEIDGGKIFATVRLQLMSNMKDFRLFVQQGAKGKYESVKPRIMAEDAASDTSDFRFELPSVGGYISWEMYVIPMGRDVKFFMNLSESLTQGNGDFTVSLKPKPTPTATPSPTPTPTDTPPAQTLPAVPTPTATPTVPPETEVTSPAATSETPAPTLTPTPSVTPLPADVSTAPSAPPSAAGAVPGEAGETPPPNTPEASDAPGSASEPDDTAPDELDGGGDAPAVADINAGGEGESAVMVAETGESEPDTIGAGGVAVAGAVVAVVVAAVIIVPRALRKRK
ncbi:MAG: hypothetical protein LBL25_01520 [Oscillospiraceae bacterium]|jgi:hypothetical protein|nr:hypothetical protein [Oscillospiraceae bacterium]